MTSGDANNGYCQQAADEMKVGRECTCGIGTSIHSKDCPYVAEWYRQDAAKREAAAFREYQRIMAEQAKASIAARETRQRLVFEGLKTTPEGGIQAIGQGHDQARTFTREEVLTVLKAHRTGIGTGPGAENADACIARLITIFERME